MNFKTRYKVNKLYFLATFQPLYHYTKLNIKLYTFFVSSFHVLRQEEEIIIVYTSTISNYKLFVNRFTNFHLNCSTNCLEVFLTCGRIFTLTKIVGDFWGDCLNFVFSVWNYLFAVQAIFCKLKSFGTKFSLFSQPIYLISFSNALTKL